MAGLLSNAQDIAVLISSATWLRQIFCGHSALFVILWCLMTWCSEYFSCHKTTSQSYSASPLNQENCCHHEKSQEDTTVRGTRWIRCVAVVCVASAGIYRNPIPCWIIATIISLWLDACSADLHQPHRIGWSQRSSGNSLESTNVK